MRNALTIDVEDYFQVSAFDPIIPRADWDNLPRRVERNIDIILEMLDARGASATFFTLGWIAERHPEMVKRIARAGHEVASHGSSHFRASGQSPEAFALDVANSKRLLEDLTGEEVKGYRAPSFSIGSGNLWALDVLGEAGFRYSSSIYPVRHDHYGMPDAPRFAFRRGDIVELPATTARLFNRNFPAAGGGYFRLLPYAVSRWMMNRVNRVDGASCIFYFHPWEIDPGQPEQDGVDFKTRFRHYTNLSKMEGKIRKLLADFSWDRMDRIFREEIA